MSRLAVMAGALALLTAPCLGVAQPVRIQVLGAGLKSCGFWTEVRHAPEASDRWIEASGTELWIEGYLTAAQGSLPSLGRALRQTDSDGLTAWIDNYCSAHPTAQLEDAAEALALYLDAQGRGR